VEGEEWSVNLKLIRRLAASFCERCRHALSDPVVANYLIIIFSVANVLLGRTAAASTGSFQRRAE
jgi:hypothetical protein